MRAATHGTGVPLLWTDAHNHLHDPRLDRCRDSWPSCVVNSTRESDWESVLAITTPPGRHAALGIHPWFAHTATNGWQERLHARLREHPDASVGECGLDGKTSSSPIVTQRQILTGHLDLARELDRPITIHCVAAWAHLLDALRESPPPRRWLLHGFGGSSELAHRFAAMGAYFSISPRAVAPSGGKMLRTFREIPRGRILLETDAPNHSCDPASAGVAIARGLGMLPCALADLTHANFIRFLSGS